MQVSEVPILEKAAFRKRTGQFSQVGFLLLSDKRLVFQPKMVFRRSPFTWLGFFFIWASILPLSLGFFYFGGANPSVDFSNSFLFPYVEALLLGFSMTTVGAVMMGVAYIRKPKDVSLNLAEIVSIEPPPKKWKELRINSKNGKRETFNLPDRNELLDELKFLLAEEKGAVPSSLVLNEEVVAPQYYVPTKYSGVALRLQRDYDTPKICCACGEPASNMAITAKSPVRPSSNFLHTNMPLALGKPRTPYNHPFPVCATCYKVHSSAKRAGIIGGVLGLLVGVTLFVSVLFSGYFFSGISFVAEFLSFFGGFELAGVFGFILLVASAAYLFVWVGWMIGNKFSTSIALSRVPKAKRSFYETLAANEAIRILRSPGYVAFGFLSKDFAGQFQQINGGVATAVSPPSKGQGGRQEK
jgi:hypothetical protein